MCSCELPEPCEPRGLWLWLWLCLRMLSTNRTGERAGPAEHPPHRLPHPAGPAAFLSCPFCAQAGCSVPALHGFLLSPAPPVSLLGASLPFILGREGAGAGRGKVGAGPGGPQGLLQAQALGNQSPATTPCPQQPDQGSGAGPALAEDTFCSG